MVTLEKGPIPPANRLPPEVLTRILPFRTFERTLVISTHICRHRRSPILLVSTLRPNIPSRDLDRAPMHLERLKDALIDFHATSPSSNFRVDDILSCRIERTRLLRANLPRDVRSAVLQFRGPVLTPEALVLFGFTFNAPRRNSGKMDPLVHGRGFDGLHCEPPYECLVFHGRDFEAEMYALFSNDIDTAVIVPTLFSDKTFSPLSKIKKLEFKQHDVPSCFPLAEFKNLEVLRLDDCWEEFIFSALLPSKSQTSCSHLRGSGDRPSDDREFLRCASCSWSKLGRKSSACSRR